MECYYQSEFFELYGMQLYIFGVESEMFPSDEALVMMFSGFKPVVELNWFKLN